MVSKGPVQPAAQLTQGCCSPRTAAQWPGICDVQWHPSDLEGSWGWCYTAETRGQVCAAPTSRSPWRGRAALAHAAAPEPQISSTSLQAGLGGLLWRVWLLSWLLFQMDRASAPRAGSRASVRRGEGCLRWAWISQVIPAGSAGSQPLSPWAPKTPDNNVGGDSGSRGRGEKSPAAAENKGERPKWGKRALPTHSCHFRYCWGEPLQMDESNFCLYPFWIHAFPKASSICHLYLRFFTSFLSTNGAQWHLWGRNSAFWNRRLFLRVRKALYEFVLTEETWSSREWK